MPEPEPKDFGEVLEKLLFDRGMTDGMLADCLHKNRVTVYRWRTEGRPPDASTLKDICDCLKLTTDEKKEFYAAAGYYVVLGQPTQSGASPTEAPDASAPTLAYPDEDAILSTPEPPIIKSKPVNEMLNPPRPPIKIPLVAWIILFIFALIAAICAGDLFRILFLQ